jgi:hypothetical protein
LRNAKGTAAVTSLLDVLSTSSQVDGSPLFYLGSHQPHWLWKVDFPLFVSRRTLQRRAPSGLRKATCRWALDSGGFTELLIHGRWTLSAADYVDLVALYTDRIGNLDWVAPQDWMCEPFMIERTGLSVREHQERTVANYLELSSLAPHLHIKPVLQGDTPKAYFKCLDLYRQAGVDLTQESLVGLGSVCRRQSTSQIHGLVRELATAGLKLHGFGVKTQGLNRYGSLLASADSLAWSFQARRSPALRDCTGHRNCANCLVYATSWRSRLLRRLRTPLRQSDSPTQLALWGCPST